LFAGIEALHGAGAANVLVSRAAEPSVALVDGEVLEISSPCFSAMDHPGASDSMFAAIGALGSGEEPISAPRLRVAAGALNAIRHGLGPPRGDRPAGFNGRGAAREAADHRLGKPHVAGRHHARRDGRGRPDADAAE
jgi:hypothetical protein